MKIGIISYRKYEERVLLNETFSIGDLFSIMLNDKEFVKFQIVDEKENLLLSTDYSQTENTPVEYLQVNKVKREEEILGTTYNAYATPHFVYKTKVTWTVNGGIYNSRKDARKYVEESNLNAKLLIKKVINRKNV